MPDLTHQSTISDIRAFLEGRPLQERLDAFPIEQIADVAAWSGPPSSGIRARLLLALHSANRSPTFSDACAEAIVSTSEWSELLSALLRNAHMGGHVIATMSKVLHLRKPEHPLAKLHKAAIRGVRICDAIDDGTRLRVTRSSWSEVGEGKCWLLGLADPVSQIADAVAVYDGDEVIVDPGQAHWLERDRLACPAFIAIAA